MPIPLLLAGLTGFCAQPLAQATFESLADKITRCQLSSIEQVLPLLPEDLLSNYVLMHQSQSLQRGSPEDPRALLYGKDARLVLAFNGDPSQSHYDTIELMQFRDSTASFEFRKIQFTTAGAVISDPNPSLCLSCHRQDPRPNFATYPLWPGAFGGEDDSVFRKNSPQTGDSESYANFIAHSKSTGRYAYLSDRPKADLPNSTFGSLAQQLNFKRIARIAAASPLLQPYRYALLASVGCHSSETHSDLKAFVPAATQASFKTGLEQMVSATEATNRNSFLSRVKELKIIYSDAPETERVQDIAEDTHPDSPSPDVSDVLSARLRWIAENAGERMDDWSMVFHPMNYDFENGYTGIADLLSPLAEALLVSPDDQVLKLTLEHSQPDTREDACAELQTKSLAALGLPQGAF